MVKYIISLFSVFAILNTFSLDSQNLIEQSLKVADGLLHTDMEAAEKQARSALALAQKIGYKDGEAEAYSVIGKIHFNEGEIDESGVYFKKAADIFKKSGNQTMYATSLKDYADFLRTKGKPEEAIKTLNEVRVIAKKSKLTSLDAECDLIEAMVEFTSGNIPAATDHTLKALKKAEEIEDNHGVVNAYLQLGNINSIQGNIEGANIYFLKALELNKKIGNKLGEADASCNIGSNYLKEGEFEKAAKYILLSIDICRKLDYRSTLALNLMNLGYLKVANKNYEEGERLLKESESLFASMKNNNGLAEVQNTLGYLYSSKRDFANALDYYKKSLECSKKMKTPTVLQSAYAGMAYVFAQQKDFEAAYHYEKLNDELAEKTFNHSNSNLVTQKQMNYEFEKIQKEQAKEQLLKDQIIVAKTSRVRILIASIVLILFLLGGLVFAIYMAYHFANKSKKLLADKNQLLQIEKEDKERIIHEVLPTEIKQKLLANRSQVKEKLAHVMFVDFVDFGKKEDLFDPYDLMEHMDELFRLLGNVAKKYDIETMKTMTDGYLYISGLDGGDLQSCFTKIIDACIDIHRSILQIKEVREAQGKPYLELRIGIHSGFILGGVVGVRTLNSDIWGNTVQVASSLEKMATPNEVFISKDATQFINTDKYTILKTDKKIESNYTKSDVFKFLYPEEITSLKVSQKIDEDFFKNLEG